MKKTRACCRTEEDIRLLLRYGRPELNAGLHAALACLRADFERHQRDERERRKMQSGMESMVKQLAGVAAIKPPHHGKAEDN